jgi:RecA/RadA recombinase
MDLYKKILKSDSLSERLSKEDEAPQDFISTGVISLNLLFSGKVDGGIPMNKISMIAAGSTLGKTIVSLSLMRSFQKKVPDGIVVLFDTEKSFDFEVAKKFKIDTAKEKFLCVKMNRIENIEHELSTMTADLTEEEQSKIFFVIDSWAGLITSKTVNDSIEGKDVMDMTEPKKKNRLAKVLLTINSTFFVINGVYDNIGGYGELLTIPGARRIYFNSHCVVLGKSKSKDKEGDDITGAIIKCVCHKSRYAREKSELEYRIKYEGGLDTFYGLLDDAIEGDFVFKPKGGRFSRKHIKDDKEFREKDIYNPDFWTPVFKDTNFIEFLENKYSFKNNTFDVAEDDTDLGFSDE